MIRRDEELKIYIVQDNSERDPESPANFVTMLNNVGIAMNENKEKYPYSPANAYINYFFSLGTDEYNKRIDQMKEMREQLGGLTGMLKAKHCQVYLPDGKWFVDHFAKIRSLNISKDQYDKMIKDDADLFYKSIFTCCQKNRENALANNIKIPYNLKDLGMSK